MWVINRNFKMDVFLYVILPQEKILGTKTSIWHSDYTLNLLNQNIFEGPVGSFGFQDVVTGKWSILWVFWVRFKNHLSARTLRPFLTFYNLVTFQFLPPINFLFLCDCITRRGECQSSQDRILTYFISVIFIQT